MNTIKNIYAVILASLVLIITVLILLVIWDVIQLDYNVLKKAFWSLIVLFTSSAVVMFIFNNLYKPSIKPPVPPHVNYQEREGAAEAV